MTADDEDPIVEDPLDGSPVRRSILEAPAPTVADLERALDELVDRQIGVRSIRALMKRNARRYGAARALEEVDENRRLGGCATWTEAKLRTPDSLACVHYDGPRVCGLAQREALEKEVRGEQA